MKNISDKTLCQIYAECEHEKVVLWSDPAAGYRGIIAIHSTALGPAVGGTRLWNYPNDEAASRDVLRLSRAMSYKNALAGLPLGGGKAVIIADSRSVDREKIFHAHGRFVDSLGGRFITAEDVGTRPEDMEFVRQETKYAAGLMGQSGDPSPVTAHGVFRAMQACAQHLWNSDSIAGRRVAIQGCGSTGYHLARELHQAGARLVVADLDHARVKTVVDQFGAQSVSTDEIFATAVDIFSPCALGGILNTENISQLQAQVVVGSANNQLLEIENAEQLSQRGILYAPDYVANAGGIINGCRELLAWRSADAARKVEEIYDTMLEILSLAKEERISPAMIADRMAERRLATAAGNSSPES
jgi:leucine dehydrogenase